MTLKIIFVSAVCVFTLVAAVWDMRTMKIPKWLTVPAFLAALGFHTVTGGWGGLLDSLLGFLTGFGILLVLWLIGGGGAGDVKLMGALGAWLGYKMTLWVFVASTLFVVAGSVLVLLYQLVAHGTGYVSKRYLKGPHAAKTSQKRRKVTQEEYLQWRRRRRIMPYGVPVALGTWLVLALQWNQIF